MLCGQCSEENADIIVDLLAKVGSTCTYCYEVSCYYWPFTTQNVFVDDVRQKRSIY